MLAVQVQVLILYKKKTKAWTGMEGRKAGRQLSDFQIKILRGVYEVYLKYKYNMYNCIHNVPIKTF